MKKTIILFGIILMGIINLNAQDCYTVKEINNKTENPDLSSKRFTFGIKQMTEELLGEKFTICIDGKPVVVNITSIEAPTVGINFGPFMIRKKNTIVKTEILFNDKIYVGEGSAKLSVKASFAELKDENYHLKKVFLHLQLKNLYKTVFLKYEKDSDHIVINLNWVKPLWSELYLFGLYL